MANELTTLSEARRTARPVGRGWSGVVAAICIGAFGCGRKLPEPEVEIDVERLCEENCARLFGDCTGSLTPEDFGVQSESQCRSDCVSSGAWNDEVCREKYEETYVCSNALSCSEYAKHIESSLASECADEVVAWTSCRTRGEG